MHLVEFSAHCRMNHHWYLPAFWQTTIKNKPWRTIDSASHKYKWCPTFRDWDDNEKGILELAEGKLGEPQNLTTLALSTTNTTAIADIWTRVRGRRKPALSTEQPRRLWTSGISFLLPIYVLQHVFLVHFIFSNWSGLCIYSTSPVVLLSVLFTNV